MKSEKKQFVALNNSTNTPELDKCVCNDLSNCGTYVIYKFGSAYRILQYLQSLKKPVSLDEIRFEFKDENCITIVYSLLDEELIEEDSEEKRCFIISDDGRLKLRQTIFAHQV